MGTITSKTKALRLRDMGDAGFPKIPQDSDGRWLTATIHHPKSKGDCVLGRGSAHPVNPSKLVPLIANKIIELTSPGAPEAEPEYRFIQTSLPPP